MTSTVDAADAADAGHEVPRKPTSPHGRWYWQVQPSSSTLKLVMAVTGIVFALFVLVHMIGNLKVYTGAAHFDDYAHWLRTLLEPLLPYEGALWIFRVVLLGCLIAHVGCAVLLTGRARRARGAVPAHGDACPTVVHRAHDAGQWDRAAPVHRLPHPRPDRRRAAVSPAAPSSAPHRPRDMPTTTWSPAFERPAVAIFYLFAMAVLGAHLVHGLWTAVNDLGRHRTPSPAGLRRGRRRAGVGGHGGQYDDSDCRVDGAGAVTGPEPSAQGRRTGRRWCPDGDPATAWQRRTLDYRLVSPLNRGKFTVIVVGTGLAGAGCAAALGELGYHVECFTFHDAPRRAHSVAAQGGINAARGRKVDNDSVDRFVKDTVKGGDFRGREADCFRLGPRVRRG